MRYYSTNNRNHTISFQEAVIRGLGPDKGLYMPETIPVLPDSFFSSLQERSFQEIAYDVAKVFVEDNIPTDRLREIINHTVSFDAPLVEIDKNIFCLELFHGPTLAFKDFGARFLSHVLGYFAQQQEKELVILVATSGDTGSAIANGFLGVPNTKVVVLYPSQKVSEIQEKQFTTLGKNITALEVDGTFDDCQQLVKLAFLDSPLNEQFFLTSANSINIARLIPQTFYYFYAWSRLKNKNENVVFSVPSGNLGNLTAGLIAKKMGLPIHHFIASTNMNDTVPKYLVTGKFYPRSSIETISNAMDVGNPSNFARITDLFQHDHSALCEWVSGYSSTDQETRTEMRRIFETSGYVLDPHGAVGLLGLRKYLSQNPGAMGVFLETAHPAKFKDVVESALNTEVKVPESLHKFLSGTKRSIPCNSDYESFKKNLRSILTNAYSHI